MSPSISWWRRQGQGTRRPAFLFQLCYFQPVSCSFPDPQNGMMVPILLSLQACQNGPGVRGDKHLWCCFLLKPPPCPDLLPPAISLQKARADPPPHSFPLSLLSASLLHLLSHTLGYSHSTWCEVKLHLLKRLSFSHWMCLASLLHMN